MAGFLIDTSKGETPESLRRKRLIVDQLAGATRRVPQDVGEGIASLGAGLSARLGYDALEADEKAGRASAQSAISPVVEAYLNGMGGGVASPAQSSPAAAPAVPYAPASGGAPQSYFDAVKMAESGGNPNATSSSSSATGLYQFTKGTWDDLARTNPSLGLTPDGRLDPQQQERAMRAFTDQNAGILTGAGIEASPPNLYAAHFLGAGGARSVLGQPDNTPMTVAAGPEVVKANPFLANMTVGDFKAWTGRKVGGGAAPAVLRGEPPEASAIPNAAPGGPGAMTVPFPAPLPNQQPQMAEGNQPSPLDTARWPAGPVGAPTDGAVLPPNAQPTQGQLPTQGAPRRAVVKALMDAAGNPWLSDTQKAIVQSLLATEIKQADPMHALQVEKLRADIAVGKSPESVREYEFAKKDGFAGTFQDWIASKRAGAGEYGLNPIWGKGPDGKPAIIQLGKSGKPILTPLPEGFEPGRDGQKIDLGTEWGILDPTTRQLVGRVPKDLRGAEREKEVGGAQGKALASAPADIQAGQNALDILDKIEKHPGLDWGTGMTSVMNRVPGTNGYDFNNIVEQAKSGAFLQAIQQMRGLGSLSNAEGGAATAAITRMNTATSKEGFLDALKDYRKIINQGIARAQSRLDNPSATNPIAAPKGKTASGVSWSIE